MALIGAHMSAAGGLYKAFARAKELDCEAFQLFTRSQLRWDTRPLEDDEIEAWNKARRESGIKEVVSHASYLINLAGEGETKDKSRRALIEEIARCEALGINKIILHPGSAGKNDIKTALKSLSEALGYVLNKTHKAKAKILLETMAGQGSSLGRSLEEFSAVLDALGHNERIAFCVDTCHIFAAGYDLRTDGSYKSYLSLFGDALGLDRLLCWHLNDSKKPLGSNVDRHQHLGLGELGLEPFRLIITDSRFENIPALLETPKEAPGDEANLGILRGFRNEGRRGACLS